MFAGRFFRQYLEQEVRTALRDAGCRYPETLRVEVDAVAGLPQRGEQWLVVEAASQDAATSGKAGACLVVREGKANAPELPLEKARINIGRVVDVYRDGGLFRRNDLVFERHEVNRSSRASTRTSSTTAPPASIASSTTAGTSAAAPANAAPGSSATA